MLTYLIVFAVSIVICSLYRDNRKWPIFVVVFLLSLLAGLRDTGVGTDTLVYTDTYFLYATQCNSISELFDQPGFDIGFLFLAYIAKNITNDIYCFYFLIELTIQIFIALAYLRLRHFFYIKIELYYAVYLLLQFNYSLNAMRQCCALSIVLYAFSFFVEKKYLRTLIAMYFAYLFHSSSVVALSIFIVYRIVYSGISQSFKKILYLFLAAFVLFSIVYYYQLLNIFSNLHLFRDVYIINYGEESSFESRGIPYTFIVIVFLFFYVIFVSHNNKLIEFEFFLFHIMMTFIYMLSILLCLYNEFAFRIGLCFYYISLFYVIVELSNNKFSNNLRVICMTIIMMYWFYEFAFKNGDHTVPYTSKILGL